MGLELQRRSNNKFEVSRNVGMFEISESEQITNIYKKQKVLKHRINISLTPHSKKKKRSKRHSEPSSSAKDIIIYFESEKKIAYDATDQLFLDAQKSFLLGDK